MYTRHLEDVIENLLDDYDFLLKLLIISAMINGAAIVFIVQAFLALPNPFL